MVITKLDGGRNHTDLDDHGRRLTTTKRSAAVAPSWAGHKVEAEAAADRQVGGWIRVGECGGGGVRRWTQAKQVGKCGTWRYRGHGQPGPDGPTQKILRSGLHF
jgi:hypothetical protein